MLYLIVGGILLFVISAWVGINPFKLILFGIIVFILWRLGVLGLALRVLRWIVMQIMKQGVKIFGDDDDEVGQLLLNTEFPEV